MFRSGAPVQPPSPGPSEVSLSFGFVALLVIVVAAVAAAIGAGVVWALNRRTSRRAEMTRLDVFRAQMLRAPQTAPAAPAPATAPRDAPLIFVSYSRQDGQTVDQLVQVIEQAGYTVWIDRQSTGSQRFAAPIVKAIRMSKLVALMCSRHAFESDHVIREVYVAGECKKPFIAFQLDPANFPDDVLYFVSGFPRVPDHGVGCAAIAHGDRGDSLWSRAFPQTVDGESGALCLERGGTAGQRAGRSSVPNPGTWNVEQPLDWPIGAIFGLNLPNCGTAAISGAIGNLPSPYSKFTPQPDRR